MNFDNILIATDLSESSDKALLMGKLIQQSQKSRVTVLHIAEISDTWDWPALVDKFQKELKTAIEQKIDLQMKRCGVQFQTKIIFGNKSSELGEYINNNNFDLLIMGHRSERPFFSASLSKKVIGATNIPILFALNDKPISKIGCLIDMAKISPRVVNEAQPLSRLFGAHVEYFTAIPDLSSKALLAMPFAFGNYTFTTEEKENIIHKSKNTIKEKLGNIPEDSLHVSITQADISAALSEELTRHNVDLAILAKHNRGPIEQYLVGSVSRGFIDHFKGNMLILPSLEN